MKKSTKTLVPLLQFVLLAALVMVLNARNTKLLLLWGSLGIIAVAGLLFLYARRSGRDTDPEEAVRQLFLRRKILLWSCAGLITAAVLMAGLLSRSYLPRSRTLQILLLVFAGLPVAMIVFNQLLPHIESRKLDAATAPEMQDVLPAHREENRAPELFRDLRRIRRWAGAFTVMLALSALGLAFTAGLVCRRTFWLVPAFLLAYVCLICAMARIRMKIPKQIIQQSCVDRKDYPILYAMAEKARDALGCTGEIQIDLSSECNAGLAVSDGTNYLALGVTLLSVLNEEEVAAVLLHEFGHAAASTEAIEKQSQYSLWLNSSASGPIMDFLMLAFFGFFDVKYTMNYRLYEYAVSLRQEFSADQAMIRCGDPAAAGSALLKLAYFDYYHWENIREPNLYAAQAMTRTSLRSSIAAFRKAVSQRSQAWNRMAAQEIQSRSASHPTLKARLEAMGIPEIAEAPGHCSEAYRSEVDKALNYVDDYIYHAMEPDFAQRRQIFYLEPLEEVRKWEADGKPLEPGTFTDLLLALRALGRYEDMEALCDRAIAELPLYSSHDAWYLKGTLLLHRYDPRGIDCLYKSMEANSNHIEEGLEVIGRFCCLTGRQEELELYRKKALELAQKDMDAYSHMGVLEKTDRLSAEQLPEALMASLMDFLRQAEPGLLDRVYLVHKQITDDFFTSVVVLRFRKDADPIKREDLTHSAFRFLDNTTDWQFCLFDYEEVRHVHVEKIPGSCIYEAQ